MQVAEEKVQARPRQRVTTACLECQKRKQKCSRERPCRNCSRRFPPVDCIYETSRPRKFVALSDQATGHFTSAQLEDTSDDVANSKRTVLAIGKSKGSHGQYPDSNKWWSENLDPTDKGEDSDPSFNAAIRVGLVGPGTSCSRIIREMTSVLHNKPSSLGPLEQGLIQYQDRTPGVIGSDIIEAREYHPPLSHEMQQSRWNLEKSVLTNTSLPMATIEPLNYLPVEATPQNGELFHMYIKLVTQYMVSFDGQTTPNYYNDQWVPWAVQSPLLAYLGLYVASCYKAEALRIPVSKYTVAIKLKVISISLLNELLRSKDESTSDEAIAGVVHFITSEWYWGTTDNVQAHMRGLREMVRLRGGLKNLGMNGLLMKMVVLTEYFMACSLDTEPYFQPKGVSIEKLVDTDLYPLWLSTPLLPSEVSFVSIAEKLDISNETARILDDMRFLTIAILHQLEVEPMERANSKLVTTSTWIRDHIISLPPGNTADETIGMDYVYESCRLAALIYCKAIVERKPLAQVCTLQDLNRLWDCMWRIRLSKWKQIPMIFLWIILSVHPAAQNLPHALFSKLMVKGSSLYVALDNWHVVHAALESFVRLQRWIRNGLAVEAN